VWDHGETIGTAAARRTRLAKAGWLVPVLGLLVAGLGRLAAPSDLRWWLLSVGAAVTVAGSVGLAAAMIGGRREATFLTGSGRAMMMFIALTSTCLGLTVFWYATASAGASDLPVRFVILGAPFVLAVAVSGAVTTIIFTLAGSLSPRWTLVVVSAVVFLFMSIGALILQLPFNFRFDHNEQAMTEQAKGLLSAPSKVGYTSSADRSMAPGIVSAAQDLSRLGDFEVGAVALDGINLDGCTSGSDGGAGLRYWLGSSNTSSLLYCPNRAPTAGLIGTAVDHLDGPWYLESGDD
jgi:hypothetical protein